MPEFLGYQFDRLYAAAIERYRQVTTIAERDAIPDGKRWEGMLCYVTSEDTDYQLRGGLTNASWVSAANGNFFDLSANDSDDITEGIVNLFLSPTDQTKLDFITVTQAVDLDTLEADVAALGAGVNFIDEWDASSGSFPGGGTASIGDLYVVTTAGTVDSVSFAVGDGVIAKVNNASTTTFAGNWIKTQSNSDVTSVVGLTGSISKTALLAALNVEDGATADMTGSEISSAITTFLTTADWQTKLTNEEVLDFVGAAVNAGTQTKITVTYDDAGDAFDFVVDPFIIVYADLTTLLAAQGSQVDDILYEVTDASGFTTITSGRAWVRYKGVANGLESDYVIVSKEESVSQTAPIPITYADLTALVAGQGAQVDDFIYEVTDGSGFTGVTTGSVWVKYLGTTVGDETDYRIVSKEEGSASIITQDEGITVDATASTLNFIGAGVTATDAGSGVTDVTITSGGDVSKVGTPVDNEVAVWTGDGTLEGDSNWLWDGSDMGIYEPVNDGSPSISLGSSATERFRVRTIYSSGTQTIERVDFITQTGSATADFGMFRFYVDDVLVAEIRDDGINVVTGKVYKINDTEILSATALSAAVQVGVNSLNSGTSASATTYWRGDGSWAVVTVDLVSNVAQDVILGRVSAGSGNSEELTAAQVRTLINVEDGADVTDAANVDAAGATMNTDTDVSSNSYVLDEDTMSSDSATKLATQQSIKAYVDTSLSKQAEVIGIACSDETTDLAVDTGVVEFQMPFAMTLSNVIGTVTTAPTGSTIIVDINDGGTSIMTTNKISIDATEKTSETAATPPTITDSALAKDAVITVDIDQIGSTVAGTGLKIWLIGTRT